MAFDNVLYIIGNGFDLHHGVPSSYRSFSLWLQRKNHGLYNKLNAVCNVDYLWKDFESALAYVDRDYFLSMGDAWLPYGWTEDDGYAELFYAEDVVRNEADELWNEIQKWFRKWVCSISWREEYDRRKIYIDDHARFVTFNYTPFLETQYGIPSENILYIHGKKADKRHLPSIGHDGRDTFGEWYKYADKSAKRHYKGMHSQLPEVEMMTGSVEQFYILSEKPVNKIITEHKSFVDDLYDVEHIYVLGHSLGNVDLPYFQAINDANDYPESIHWYVSYYAESEKKALHDVMYNNVISEKADLKMMTLDSMIANG